MQSNALRQKAVLRASLVRSASSMRFRSPMSRAIFEAPITSP
jgi:hypothetical protein